MKHRFILDVTTSTGDDKDRSSERGQLAGFITQTLEPLIMDRADRRLRKIEELHLTTGDGLISVSMDREVER